MAKRIDCCFSSQDWRKNSFVQLPLPRVVVDQVTGKVMYGMFSRARGGRTRKKKQQATLSILLPWKLDRLLLMARFEVSRISNLVRV